jgi:putative DNA primase/helicase
MELLMHHTSDAPGMYARAPDDVGAAALDAWDNGLQPHPAKQDGSKMPLPVPIVDEHGQPVLKADGTQAYGWKHLQTKRKTRDGIKAFFASQHRRTGLGIFTGAISGGVVLFEFDCRLTYERFKASAESLGMGDLVRRIEAGYCEDTPNGGVHWLVKIGQPGRNAKLARRPKTPEEMQHPEDKTKVLIETRENGGWAVLSPSYGTVHETGHSYVLRSGSFATIAALTDAEHEQLWGLGQTFDEMPEEERFQTAKRVEGVPRKPSDGERPGDIFEHEADWFDILPAGWEAVGRNADNLLLRRPGKRVGWSATISQGGNGVLYVFTSSAHPLDPNTCYSKFSAYALLEHGGDFKAAAKAIAERYGMNKRRPDFVLDEDVWFSPPGKNGHSNSPRDGVPASGDTSSHTRPRPAGRPLTETGNAERLVDRHGGDIRYSYPWGQWLNWDGRRHQRDLTGAIMARAKETVRSIYGEAQVTENDAERAAVSAWAKRSETAGARSAMVKLAESEPGVPILPDDMDADPFLFNVLNGTVDLRTGQLRPHDRRDNITKLAPVSFDPEAAAPTFLAFLERVLPDADVRSFLQRMTGYAMTGDTSEQCLCFMCGGGANGKSTFIGVIQTMLGDYARQAAPELLVSRGGDRHPTELADLFGARLVTSIEVDEGKRLAETLVKQMTGGDKMKARFMRQDFFEWVPTHKLFLAANHRPEIRGTDYAIWRRIHLVPFTVTIPESERDPKLGEKLRAELPGILNWAIAGCLDWQRNGLGVPQAVRDATEEYRQEQDVLADFLDEHCVIDAQAYAVAGILHKTYTTWCEGNGSKPLSPTAFGRRLTERGFKADKPRIGGKQTRVWRGLGLATPTDDPSGTRSEPRYGSRHENADSSPPPPREGETRENAYQRVPAEERVPDQDVAVCETDGCTNGADGPGLHCDDCLSADVEEGVPW